jgi:large subunit ribosomal protein L15
MPLMRRLPKKGFNYPFKNIYQVVNVESLNRFKANSIIGPKELKETDLIGSEKCPVKILGDGKLSKVLIIKAHKFSESAKKKIEESGSKYELINK